MLAQQWVENSQARDEMETGEGEIEKEMDAVEKMKVVHHRQM